MRAHLDTSALVELIVAQPESPALQDFLDETFGDELFVAALSRAELLPAVACRGSPAAKTQERHLLDAIDTVILTRSVLDDAGGLGPIRLRSLDAIHLTAAMRTESTLRAVVTHDARTIDAAERLGLKTAAPK